MEVSPFPIKTLLTEWSQAEGKTLTDVREEGVHFPDYLVLRFGDEAVLLRQNYESYGYFSGEPEELNPDYDMETLVYFGLSSLEEYEAKQRRREQQARDEAEDAERMTYERLRRKYGP